jgi:DNA-binding transcriptional regulator LsrR (DeoR family)
MYAHGLGSLAGEDILVRTGLISSVGLEDVHRAPLAVACVGGDEKIPALAGALRGRLFNTLVTDENIARGVHELVDGNGRRTDVTG